MEKNIMIIGCESAGKASLVAAMQNLVHVTERAISKMQTLTESLEQQKSLVIEHRHSHELYAFDGTSKKSKEKKAYWKNGKRKFK